MSFLSAMSFSRRAIVSSRGYALLTLTRPSSPTAGVTLPACVGADDRISPNASMSAEQSFVIRVSMRFSSRRPLARQRTSLGGKNEEASPRTEMPNGFRIDSGALSQPGDPVHAGHAQVKQHEIESLDRADEHENRLQRASWVNADVGVEFFELSFDQLANQRVIVGDDHVQRRSADHALFCCRTLFLRKGQRRDMSAHSNLRNEPM